MKLISTGFRDLDIMLGGGFAPGSINLMASRPSMGKSTLMANIAQATATPEHKAVFYALQTSEGMMRRRECPSRNVLIEDRIFSVSAIADHCAELVREGRRVALVVVDDLSLIPESLEEVLRFLKFTARSIGCGVLLAKNLGPGVDRRTNKRPMLSDLESEVLQTVCDSILLLYRDEYYYHDSNDQGRSELTIAKNRQGYTGTIRLWHDLASGAFSDLEEVAPCNL